MSNVVGARLRTCALCGGPLGRNLVVCDRCGYHRRPMLHVDATGRIAEDLPCQQCGYNLRGHGGDDRCPECGTPVRVSVRRDLLKHADPTWLERLALGCRIMAAACIAIVTTDLALYVLALLAAKLSIDVFTVVTNGAQLLRAGLTLAVAAGGWVLTTPEPARALPERTASARRVARWCVAIVAAATLLREIGPDTLAPVIRYPRTLAVLVGTAAMLVYVRALALRVPHDRLARQARIVTWGYVSCQVVVVLLVVVFSLAFHPQIGGGPAVASQPWIMAHAAVSGATGVAALVFGVLGIGVLIRSARALRREAAAARAARDDREA